MRRLATLCVSAFLASGLTAAEKAKPAPAATAPKNGVKTPGVQIPFASLKADLEYVKLALRYVNDGQNCWLDKQPSGFSVIDRKTGEVVTTS